MPHYRRHLSAAALYADAVLLHTEVRAGLWEGAGRLAVTLANQMVRGALSLGMLGRRLQTNAQLVAHGHGQQVELERQRAAAMRRHPSWQSREGQ